MARRTAPTRKSPPRYPRTRAPRGRRKTAHPPGRLRSPCPPPGTGRCRRQQNRVHRADAEPVGRLWACSEPYLQIAVNEHLARSSRCSRQGDSSGQRHWRWCAIHNSFPRQQESSSGDPPAQFASPVRRRAGLQAKRPESVRSSWRRRPSQRMIGQATRVRPRTRPMPDDTEPDPGRSLRISGDSLTNAPSLKAGSQPQHDHSFLNPL